MDIRDWINECNVSVFFARIFCFVLSFSNFYLNPHFNPHFQLSFNLFLSFISILEFFIKGNFFSLEHSTGRIERVRSKINP